MPKSRSRKRKKSPQPSPAVPLLDFRTMESLLAAFGGSAWDEDDCDDDVGRAQDIVYDAWEAPDRRRRVALAKKALAVSADCADAYVLLAQETARTTDEALDLYRQGVEAGERALGEAAFTEDVGSFWGLLETRPYMRARFELARTLWTKGSRDDAVAHYQDMLRLNPNDNQGIRYVLIDALLELGRDDAAGALLRRYRDDGSVGWAWSKALLLFRRKGDCKASRDALSKAAEAHPHVAAYLTGRKKLPRRLPELIAVGSEDEAVDYVAGAAGAWAAAGGALAWVVLALAGARRPRLLRRPGGR